jgi:hypothetical protein
VFHTRLWKDFSRSSRLGAKKQQKWVCSNKSIHTISSWILVEWQVACWGFATKAVHTRVDMCKKQTFVPTFLFGVRPESTVLQYSSAVCNASKYWVAFCQKVYRICPSCAFVRARPIFCPFLRRRQRRPRILSMWTTSEWQCMRAASAKQHLCSLCSLRTSVSFHTTAKFESNWWCFRACFWKDSNTNITSCVSFALEHLLWQIMQWSRLIACHTYPFQY